MLKFPDNTVVSVKGLDDIMAALFAENRKADETAKEMIKMLKEEKSFIPSSESVHREYATVLCLYSACYSLLGKMDIDKQFFFDKNVEAMALIVAI